MKKWAPYIVILVLAAVLFFVKLAQRSNNDAAEGLDTDENSGQTRGFNRMVDYINYTEHANCRMKCRHISEEEVNDIMLTGKINYKKSDLKAQPCPKYALEGRTSDDQRVRIIFAQCGNTMEVVTCIDLETDWSCDCPGENKAHDNKSEL